MLPTSDARHAAHVRTATGRTGARVAKRALDVAGSLVLLTATLPLTALICLGIAMTSRGPILFRQERVGLGGRRFTLLKFRSMVVESDAAVHASYVRRFIDGDVDGPRFKLANDPRITSIGRLLRRTSLDELPQLLNVLAGTMSLVGPRPPIPYELDAYAPWHHGRLAVRPGLTGLWQVQGRNRVTFDEMVRLDLEYVSTWSIWLDVKILCRTPRAMLAGDGAP